MVWSRSYFTVKTEIIETGARTSRISSFRLTLRGENTARKILQPPAETTDLIRRGSSNVLALVSIISVFTVFCGGILFRMDLLIRSDIKRLNRMMDHLTPLRLFRTQTEQEWPGSRWIHLPIALCVVAKAVREVRRYSCGRVEVEHFLWELLSMGIATLGVQLQLGHGSTFIVPCSNRGH